MYMQTRDKSLHTNKIVNAGINSTHKYPCLMENATSSNEYKNAFNRYIRYGAEETSYKNSQTEAGYPVTAEMLERIYCDLLALNPLRQLATVTQISSDTYEILDPENQISAGWADAGLAAAEQASPMKFVKQTITVQELYAQAKTTQKLLDDQHTNIEEWLTNALVEAFHKAESNAFFNGDGNNKPTGLLKLATIHEDHNINVKALSVESIISLLYSLPDIYARNATFLMHRSTAEKIRLLKDESGRFLWQQNLSDNWSGVLLGIPVVISPDMPQFKQGNIVIALCDLKHAYQIVDKSSVRILRDPFTQKPLVKFLGYKYVGGAPVEGKAARFLSLTQ